MIPCYPISSATGSRWAPGLRVTGGGGAKGLNRPDAWWARAPRPEFHAVSAE